jgi:hypothetical protein
LNRRTFLVGGGLAAAGGATAAAFALTNEETKASPLPDRPLRVPALGTIRTAFLVADGFNVIDVSGSWGCSRTPQSQEAAGGSSCTRSLRRARR